MNNPARPKAVQEAMAAFTPEMLEKSTKSVLALAAYVRELEAERDRLKERNAELEDLFDLQHSRSIEADDLWRQAHPGNDLVMPNLGELLAWLMAEARKGEG